MGFYILSCDKSTLSSAAEARKSPDPSIATPTEYERTSREAKKMQLLPKNLVLLSDSHKSSNLELNFI